MLTCPELATHCSFSRQAPLLLSGRVLLICLNPNMYYVSVLLMIP